MGFYLFNSQEKPQETNVLLDTQDPKGNHTVRNEQNINAATLSGSTQNDTWTRHFPKAIIIGVQKAGTGKFQVKLGPIMQN